ncbi:MAG: 16S rRNA (guanine(527)-N(7))-methyltransferase RsmG, partial [Planctomycetota bacterium]
MNFAPETPSELASFEKAFRSAIAVGGLECSAEQIAAMRGHFEAMVEANSRFNLTRIVDPVEAAVKHYADSLALVAWARDQSIAIKTLLDVGTGAGFPAIPLAIVRPEWRITALEATEKKVKFVEEAVGALGLENVTVCHGHLTHWGDGTRFDVVTFRAVGLLRKMLPMAAKFVR